MLKLDRRKLYLGDWSRPASSREGGSKEEKVTCPNSWSYLLEKQGIDLRLSRPKTIYPLYYTVISSACVVCLFLCLCLCEHAMEPKVCLSDSFSTFKQGLLLSLKVTDWLYWLASQLLGPSCFHPTHIVIFDGIIKEIYKDIFYMFLSRHWIIEERTAGNIHQKGMCSV